MRILRRMILRDYCGALAGFFLLFSSLFILIELFDLRSDFRLEGDAPRVIARYIALRVPFIGYFSIPISVLVASVFTLAMRANRSETVAVLASGISAARFIAPLTLVSAFIAVLLVAGAEYKIPEWSDEADYLRRVVIRKQSPPARDYYNLAFPSGRHYLLIDRFSPIENVLDGVLLLTPNSDHSALEGKHALAQLRYSKGGGWLLPEGGIAKRDLSLDLQMAINSIPPPAVVELTAAATGFKPLTDKPVEAVRLTTLIEEYMTLQSIRASFEAPDKLIAEMARRMVKISVKLSFPVAIPFLSILGASIGMSLGRRRGIMFALSGALAYSLGYLLLLESTVKLADFAAETRELRDIAGLVPLLNPLLVGYAAVKRLSSR